MTPKKLCDGLRLVVTGDVWSEAPEAAEAVSWAQTLILRALDALGEKPEQPQPAQAPPRPMQSRPKRRVTPAAEVNRYSKAERAEYGLRMKLQRDRAERSQPSERMQGTKQKPAHLYRGKP